MSDYDTVLPNEELERLAAVALVEGRAHPPPDPYMLASALGLTLAADASDDAQARGLSAFLQIARSRLPDHAQNSGRDVLALALAIALPPPVRLGCSVGDLQAMQPHFPLSMFPLALDAESSTRLRARPVL